LALQKFGVSPTAFPGRLAAFVFADGVDRSPDVFTPTLLVGERLITWGDDVEERFCATDAPTREAEMRSLIAAAEAERMGAALQ
jgi:hypothetical protein